MSSPFSSMFPYPNLAIDCFSISSAKNPGQQVLMMLQRKGLEGGLASAKSSLRYLHTCSSSYTISMRLATDSSGYSGTVILLTSDYLKANFSPLRSCLMKSLFTFASLSRYLCSKTIRPATLTGLLTMLTEELDGGGLGGE